MSQFIIEITSKPFPVYGSNKPLTLFKLKLTLNQTIFMIKSSHDDHGHNGSPNHGILYKVQHAAPKESSIITFEACNGSLSLTKLRWALVFSLGFDKEMEAEVMDYLQSYLTIYNLNTMFRRNNYNNNGSDDGNGNEEEWPQYLHLELILNLFKVRHVKNYEGLSTSISAQDGSLKRKRRVDECSICLQELDETKQTVALYCDHLFHEACIFKWLSSRLNCPLCRQRVYEES